MNIYKQTKAGNSKLLLVFSGWAASPEVFRHLEPESDTDIWICYDYRGMEFEGEALSRYPEIRLIAWSLGVWVARSYLVRGKYPSPRLSPWVELSTLSMTSGASRKRSSEEHWIT